MVVRLLEAGYLHLVVFLGAPWPRHKREAPDLREHVGWPVAVGRPALTAST